MRIPPAYLNLWPDFLTDRKVLEVLSSGLPRTDPVPSVPPGSNPRPGENNDLEKRVVGPGEGVWMTVVGRGEGTEVELRYPSRFTENISYFLLEDWFSRNGVEAGERMHLHLSYLTSFRRAVFFPNEGQLRLRVDLDDNPWLSPESLLDSYLPLVPG